MSAPPYMKLFWGDYHKATRHLTRDQHGAYFLLIGEAWRLGGALPDDDLKLSAWALCTPEEWAIMKLTIMDFFALRRGKWWHDRVREELAAYEATSRKRKEAGKKGGSSGAGKTKGNAEANAFQKPTKPEPEPKPEPKKDKKGRAPQADPILEGEPSLSPADQAVALYNEVASRVGGHLVDRLTDGRRSKLNARMGERGVEGWREAMALVEKSFFLCGEVRPARGERPFKLSLDMLLRPDNFQKLLEGFYGTDRDPPPADAGASVENWSATRWSRVMEIWHARGEWPEDAGPEPGKPGFRGPRNGDDYDRQ